MDVRIVRNGAKIASVRDNARFLLEVAKEHGSFGKFLSTWPPSDEVGLLEVLAKCGGRLGGASGQMLLRFLGYDAFVVTKDVAACLRDAGLDIVAAPTSKRDPRQNPGAVQRLGERNRPALSAPVADLRHVDRREYEGDRYSGDVIAG